MQTMAVETMLCIVSETRSCAAHGFIVGYSNSGIVLSINEIFSAAFKAHGTGHFKYSISGRIWTVNFLWILLKNGGGKELQFLPHCFWVLSPDVNKQ